MSSTRHAPGVAADRTAPSPFAEFLNPNSMMTPGAAGAFTMVITNTLCQQFTPLPLNYTGLAVSLMFGAMVFGYGASLISRLMYFVINSLIIFVVAFGSNAIGERIAKGPDKVAALQSLQTDQGKSATYNIASADKPAETTAPPKKPPPKPSFFRSWM
jgi:large-conductance mechanosensitive channel